MDQCGVQCIEADVMDRHTLHEPLDMVDVVYNLASPPAGRDAGDYAKFNEVALNNLLEEANEHGAKMFVHLSCLDVYGTGGVIESTSVPRPVDEYQKSKLAAESLVMDFGRNHPDTKVRVVRASLALGPRDKTLTTSLLKMIESGKIVLPPGSSNAISLSHPKDVAQAMLKAAAYGGVWEQFLVKSFDSSIEDFCRRTSVATGRKADVKSGGFLSGKTLIPQYSADRIRANRTIKEQEFWKKISYTPGYTIEKTVEEVSEWYRREPWLTKDLA